MALRFKVLSKKVERFERKGMQSYKVNPKGASALDVLLNDVFATSRPKPIDYVARRDLVRIFNEIAKEVFAKSDDVPTVVEFGSFVMDLFSSRSDLDLSFNFTSSKVQVTRERKIQTLRKLARKFYALQQCGHVCGVHPITTAKVPILKVVDRGTGVECDLSVENRDGILKSKLIQMICSIDERFRKLSFLMKAWAKAQKINSSKDGTLNSLSIILLVAFHLQTRNPPILPPFGSLFKDGADPASVAMLLGNFVNFGRGNTESVAELLVSLLIKLASVEKLWPKGLCASVYQGLWISKTWESKVGTISVEDFTDQSQNVARAVGAAEFKVIYRCIQHSIRHIFAFMNGQIEGSNLQELLFGQAAKSPMGAGIAGSKMDGVTPMLNVSAKMDGVTPMLNVSAAVTPIPCQLTLAKGKPNIHVSHKRDHSRPSGFPLTKKMRYTYGSTSVYCGGTSSSNLAGSQQFPRFELEKVQQGMMQMSNWEGTQKHATGSWDGVGQTFASCYPTQSHASSSINPVFSTSLSYPSLLTNPTTFVTSQPSSIVRFPPQGTQQSQ